MFRFKTDRKHGRTRTGDVGPQWKYETVQTWEIKQTRSQSKKNKQTQPGTLDIII